MIWPPEYPEHPLESHPAAQTEWHRDMDAGRHRGAPLTTLTWGSGVRFTAWGWLVAVTVSRVRP
jgi:hypothetical protein